MNAGPAASKKSSDGTVGLDRRQQLHERFTERQRHDGRAIGDFGRIGLDAEDIAVEGKRGVHIGYGNTDMGNPGAVSHAVAPTIVVNRSGINHRENNIMGTTNAQTLHVTDASFASEIEQANGLVLVDFWATWCGPCQIVAPVLEQLATEYAGRAKVAKVDVDANQRTAMRFNVRSIPSILFFKNGQHVDTVIGAVPKATLEGKIKQHIG